MAKIAKIVAGVVRLKKKIRRKGRHNKRPKKHQRQCQTFFGSGHG